MFAPFQKKKKKKLGGAVKAPLTHTHTHTHTPETKTRGPCCSETGSEGVLGLGGCGDLGGAPPGAGVPAAPLPGSEGPIPAAARRGRPRARVPPPPPSPGDERGGQPSVLAAPPRPAPQLRPSRCPQPRSNLRRRDRDGSPRDRASGGKLEAKVHGLPVPSPREFG